MLSNSWFRKEKPLTGLLGAGGGVGSRLVSSAGFYEGPFSITGGNTVVTTPTHKYHAFTSSGSIVVSEGDGSPGECSGTIDFFILAGGGGGSGSNDATGGGGGGAGGGVEGVSFQIYAGTHTITRGGGANGGANSVGPDPALPNTAGEGGDPSWINFTTGLPAGKLKVEAIGGGGGVAYGQNNDEGEGQGGNGGCGGSGNGGSPGGEATTAPNSPVYPSCPGTVTSHGNDGPPTGGAFGSGGGGSGLGGVGEAPSVDGTNYGGDGGTGGAFPKWPGTELGPTAYPGTWTAVVGGAGTYGGGGGGANYNGAHGDQGTGGPGGGGAGGGSSLSLIHI